MARLMWGLRSTKALPNLSRNVFYVALKVRDRFLDGIWHQGSFTFDTRVGTCTCRMIPYGIMGTRNYTLINHQVVRRFIKFMMWPGKTRLPIPYRIDNSNNGNPLFPFPKTSEVMQFWKKWSGWNTVQDPIRNTCSQGQGSSELVPCYALRVTRKPDFRAFLETTRKKCKPKVLRTVFAQETKGELQRQWLSLQAIRFIQSIVYQCGNSTLTCSVPIIVKLAAVRWCAIFPPRRTIYKCNLGHKVTSVPSPTTFRFFSVNFFFALPPSFRLVRIKLFECSSWLFR